MVEITYKHIKLINFPVFAIPSIDIYMDDGIVKLGDLVVDDLNQIGTTLGQRRLQTPHKLQRIYKCYDTIQAFITAGTKPAYIDNLGYIFKYKKTKYVKICYHKILNILRKEDHTILKVQGVTFPVILKSPPPRTVQWVGMIYLGKYPWHPYNYSTVYCKPKRRKI